MKLILLGTGGPEQNPARMSQSSLLVTDTERILVDAGRGATHQLSRAGVDVAQVDRILVTHHHFDHIGELGIVLLGSWDGGRATPVHVAGPPGTQAIVDALMGAVYGPDIRWRQAERAAWAAMAEDPDAWPQIDPHALAAVVEVIDGPVWPGDPIRVTAAESEHGRTYLKLDDWHSVAYRVEANNRSIVFSGDTALSQPLIDLARGVDVLVLNCYASETEVASPWARVFSRTMIASSAECGRIAAAAGAGKLVLSHFGAGMTFDSVEADVRQHYGGPLVIGEDLLEVEV